MSRKFIIFALPNLKNLYDMDKAVKNETSSLIDINFKEIQKLQSQSNIVIRNFFEKVFEDNGQTPIRYNGENESSNNLIIDEGAIIEVREIYPDVETIHSGEKVYSIKVRGVLQEDYCPYENSLMNLDYQSIVSIFEMFKDQL